MRFEHARPSADDPLLRYSLAELREVIFEALRVAGARSVVEVGAESGTFTEQLVEWVHANEGRLVLIDPAPGEAVRKLAEADDLVTLHEQTSHQVLGTHEPIDAYLLDGDHNYFTVHGELLAIHAAHEAASGTPLIMLQDVGWPSGRRDQYYEPGSIPDHARHPFDFGGTVPWSDATVTGGFRGEGRFAVASHEGGPRNGVLTALEDFLADHPGYRSLSVPCFFGLAIVYPDAAPWADDLSGALGCYDDSPLLARLESNRVLLYLTLIDLQDRFGRAEAAGAEKAAKLEAMASAARTRAAIAEQSVRHHQEVQPAAPPASAPRPVPPPSRWDRLVRRTGRSPRPGGSLSECAD